MEPPTREGREPTDIDTGASSSLYPQAQRTRPQAFEGARDSSMQRCLGFDFHRMNLCVCVHCISLCVYVFIVCVHVGGACTCICVRRRSEVNLRYHSFLMNDRASHRMWGSLIQLVNPQDFPVSLCSVLGLQATIIMCSFLCVSGVELRSSALCRTQFT